MTKEELLDWKHNSVTREILDAINKALEIVKEDLPYYSTDLNEMSLENARMKGYLEGVSAFKNFIEEDL